MIAAAYHNYKDAGNFLEITGRRRIAGSPKPLFAAFMLQDGYLFVRIACNGV